MVACINLYLIFSAQRKPLGVPTALRIQERRLQPGITIHITGKLTVLELQAN